MLGTKLDWPAYFLRLQETLASVDANALQRCSDILWQAYQNDHCVFIIGNGGSGSNAAHFCQDFSQSTVRRSEADSQSRPRLRTLNLTENSAWLLAVGNDLGFDQVFAQPLRTLARRGDVLIAISGSGNSANILEAVRFADGQAMPVIALTGFDGGQLARAGAGEGHCHIHVPIADMGIVESVHLSLFHWILDDLYAKIYRIDRYQP